MFPNVYLSRLAAQIVKRSGICRATVEAVLPHVFDAIRYEIVEGRFHCVPIESFGTFALKELPERHYLNNYKGANEMRHLPSKLVVKFAPTRNMRREVEQGKFDSTRHSFKHHPDDPIIRKRKDMRYKPGGTDFRCAKKVQNET